MKTTLLKLALFLLILAAVAILSCIVRNQHQEISRLSGNQTALLDSVSYYKTESGKHAASVKILELTKSELEDNCKGLAEQVKTLGIKLRRAEAVAQTATKTALEFQAKVRDSIIYVVDSTATRHYLDSLRKVEWSDPWVNFHGELRGDDLTAKIESVDTLTTILHRVPRKCWLIRWKKNEYRVEVVSSNPHTKIVYEQYVKVSK